MGKSSAMFLHAAYTAAATVAIVILAADAATADPCPSACAAPGIAASPAPRALGLHTDTFGAMTFIDQESAGDGVVGPEAPGFIAGSPLSPNTPYDVFSSAPQVSGIAGITQLVSTATYGLTKYDLGITAGLGYVRGSVTNAAYWGENLFPPLNPHLGTQALPYRIAFPSHPGQDDGTAFRLSILAASFATADGALQVRGGWFDLTQSDRFVFVQPPLTNVTPQIGYAPAESLGNGTPTAAFWQPSPIALPLHGLDAVAHRGGATFELTTAALPSLPGEAARMSMGSIVLDRGEGTRFSAQVLHATTSGLPFITTIPTGLDPQFTPTAQGVLPTSILSGQRQTIAGVRAAFHAVPTPRLDGVVEIGRAWYDAAPVNRPGTQRPGGFYHAGLVRARGRTTASVDFYRMEPRYATMILPYGVPENQWSVSFAWPGQWLKSNYQLIDNSVLGVNRQGYRARYYVDRGPLEVHLEYTDLRQIQAETRFTSTQAGYVDGYYLPQVGSAATFGRQRRSALWLAWHPAFADVSLDVVDDTLYRPFAPTHLEDQVSYEVPQAILTFSRRINANVTAAAGAGRYAIKGAFAEPLDFAERLLFVGAEVRQTRTSSILVSLRRTALRGLSTAPDTTRSSKFTASALILEERVHF